MAAVVVAVVVVCRLTACWVWAATVACSLSILEAASLSSWSPGALPLPLTPSPPSPLAAGIIRCAPAVCVIGFNVKATSLAAASVATA